MAQSFLNKKSGFSAGKGFDPTAKVGQDKLDPLANVDYESGKPFEEVAREELTELQKGFAERRAKEADRFRLATDSEFWFAVAFKSRAHKEEFLKQWLKQPTLDMVRFKANDKYLDGHHVARMVGIDLSNVEA